MRRLWYVIALFALALPLSVRGDVVNSIRGSASSSGITDPVSATGLTFTRGIYEHDFVFSGANDILDLTFPANAAPQFMRVTTVVTVDNDAHDAAKFTVEIDGAQVVTTGAGAPNLPTPTRQFSVGVTNVDMNTTTYLQLFIRKSDGSDASDAGIVGTIRVTVGWVRIS